MLRSGNRAARALLTAVALAAAAAAQVPKVSASSQRALEDLARELVRAGRAPAADTVVLLAQALGNDAAATTRLRAKLAKEKRGTPDSKKDAAAAARARKTAAVLAQDLDAQTSDVARRALADAVVRLDDQAAASQALLSRRSTPDGWLDDAGSKRAANRAQWASAVARARALEFAVESGPSDNAVITAQVQDRGGRAAYGGFEIHMFEGPGRAAAALRQGLRARALLAWLHRGTFEFDVARAPPQVMTPWPKRYEAAVATSVAAKELSPEEAEAAKKTTLFVGAGKTAVYLLYRDEMISGWILRQLADSAHALDEGALDLVAMVMTGCFMGLVPQTGKDPLHHHGAYYVGEHSTEATWMAHAGILGARTYVAGLGAAGRPRLVELAGKRPSQSGGNVQLQGLVACTLLIEEGLANAVLGSPSKPPDLQAAAWFEKRLAMPAAVFDDALAQWLQPPAAGLAQQLDAFANAGTAALRSELERVRKQALGNVINTLHTTLRWNDRLDRGCADLLAEAGGGAHTALGAEASLHAVVAAGPDVAAAVRMLLTSVHGRTALFDIGTIEAGAAFAGGRIAVDTGSVRHPVMTDCTWFWPSQGSTQVPTKYAAGLPAPPGVDPAGLGYPLTVQMGLPEEGPPPRVGLRVAEHGTETWLPCHRFDPDRPLPGGENLMRTYGIIPHAPLKPRTKYELLLQLDQREAARIVFTTGG